MQGYLYHRPISLLSFIDVLQDQNRLSAASASPPNAPNANLAPSPDTQPAMVAIQA
jgi:hypothetical protein